MVTIAARSTWRSWPGRSSRFRGRYSAAGLIALGLLSGCRAEPPQDRVRASGHVEATEVQVAPEVGGRLLELRAREGDRVNAGDLLAQLDTRDAELARRRALAERQQADAQLRLLEAGSRPEDIHRAEAEAAASDAEVEAAQAERSSAEADLQRFAALLAANSGSRKQRDDAETRRDVARERLRAAEERRRATRAGLARLRAGARREEIEAARARLAAIDAQIATVEKSLADATVRAPAGGVITEKLADAGEIAAARTPILVITDLDHAWAEVFVDEPLVPRLTLGQAATIFTDAGGDGLPGTVTFISSKAEFTPRNVQTAEERAKLVYRVKVSVDNRQGILKAGMPIEAELPLRPISNAR